MEGNLKKLGENERIILFANEPSEDGLSDGLIIQDKKTKKISYTTPLDKEYKNDIDEIIDSIKEKEEAKRLFGLNS